MAKQKREFYHIWYGSYKRGVKYAQIVKKTFDLDHPFFGYDKSIFSCGTKLTPEQIDELHKYHIFMTSGEPLDLLNSPWGLIIVSQKCWNIIRPFVDNHVQVVQAPFYYEDTNKNAEYLIINPLLTIHAKYAGHIHDMAIDINKIPTDVHLFRLAWRDKIEGNLFSNTINKVVRREQLTGIAWIPVLSKEEYGNHIEKERQMIEMSSWEYAPYYVPHFELTWERENDQYVTGIQFEGDDLIYTIIEFDLIWPCENDQDTTSVKYEGNDAPKKYLGESKIFLSTGDKTDYVSNNFNLQIVSKRFYNKIKHLLPKGSHIIPIPMCCEEANNIIDDYVVLHSDDLFLAMPPEIDPHSPGLRLIKDIIPERFHSFQVAAPEEKSGARFLFSQEIKDIYDNNSFNGCTWLPTFWERVRCACSTD